MYRLLSGILEVIDGEDLQTGIADEAVGLGHVGTLETGNDGNLEVKSLNRVDETVGNEIAADDTAEDVDEDGGDLGVAGDELEGLLNGLGGSTTTDVEEVGGLAAVELDDIHGSHGKTGTIDEAADIAVELDEVEVGLGGPHLIGILLGGIAPREDLLLAEVGVVVETKLSVHAENLVVGSLGEGVDLDLGSILLEEDLVELLDGVLGILDALVAEAEAVGNIVGDRVRDTLVDVDVGSLDSLGVLLGDALDIDTTLGRGHDDGALAGTVHEDGKVELAASKLALADVHSTAKTAASARLLRYQLVADHLLGEHLRLVRRVDDANASLKTVIESTLSSTTGKNLGFYHHIIGADLLGNFLGLVRGVSDGALGNLDAILDGS